MRALEKDVCLQCSQSRAEVKTNRTYCATLTRGESIEVDAEWDRHRWADWNDKDLDRAGVKPEFYDLYRRASAWDLDWLACEHTVRGHVPSDGSDEDREYFGTVAGQCIACGQRDVA